MQWGGGQVHLDYGLTVMQLVKQLVVFLNIIFIACIRFKLVEVL